MKSVLVVGLGNEMRGDDAAGLLAARAVRDFRIDGIDVEEHADAAGLAESMARHAHVVIIDTVAGAAPAGTVRELDPGETALRGQASSHGVGLLHAVNLARTLGANPEVRVFGIAGSTFTLGAAPSPVVVHAAADLAARIKEMLRCA